MKRKILSLALTIAVCLELCVVIVGAAAAANTCGMHGSNLTWNFDQNTGTLTISGTGDMYDWNVPCGEVRPWNSYSASVRNVVIEPGVTSIGACAFYYFSNLSNVSIPGSVTDINWSAFENCTNLRSVVIPEGVTTVGSWAFQNCSNLTSVSIPASLTVFNNSSFSKTPWYGGLGDFVIINGIMVDYQGNGGEVFIPGSVTKIVGMRNTSDMHVTIPSSVTEIVKYAFEGCSGVTGFTVEAGNPNYSSWDGVLFNADRTRLISYPNGRRGAYTIPSSVTAIEPGAFSSCTGLTSITIPNSVCEIGKLAFSSCNGLTNVTIPGSVTSIDESVFSNCKNLTSATFEAGVKRTGQYIFNHCENLRSVTFPDTLTSIDYCAFWGCTALKRLDIPGSVTSIGTYAFNISLDTPIPGLTLHGVTGSRAESYAKEKGIPFVADLSPVSPQPQRPANPSKTESAMPTNDKLTVNGKLADPTVYKIGDSNYFKIRDVAALLNGTEKQFAVGYDKALKSVTATTGQGYAKLDSDLLGAATGGNKTAEISNDTVYVNGQRIDAQVYKIDGGNYFKLRDLGKALNFSVEWTREAGMMIDTGKPYTE